MKIIVSIMLLISSLQIQSQVDKEYNSIEKTGNCLLGYWTKSGNSYSEIHYLVDKVNKDYYVTIGVFKKGGLEFLCKSKIRLNITIDEKHIFIKKFEQEGELILLNYNNMFLKNGNNISEYKKLKK